MKLIIEFGLQSKSCSWPFYFNTIKTHAIKDFSRLLPLANCKHDQREQWPALFEWHSMRHLNRCFVPRISSPKFRRANERIVNKIEAFRFPYLWLSKRNFPLRDLSKLKVFSAAKNWITKKSYERLARKCIKNNIPQSIASILVAINAYYTNAKKKSRIIIEP